MSDPTKTSVAGRTRTTTGRSVRTSLPRRRSSDLSSYDCSELGEQSGFDVVKDCLELMLSLEFFQRYKARTFELLEIGSGSSVWVLSRLSAWATSAASMSWAQKEGRPKAMGRFQVEVSYMRVRR